MTASQYSQRGFTLVELAIVLVIIGLIVGGVLVGQDMIRAAELRSTVGQYEKYNSALNTFRTKYNGMPGDLLSSSASNFGMVTRTGAAGHGNGNGLLEGCSAAAISTASVAGCETTLFWVDLSFANLIDGNYTTATDALTQVATGAVRTVFPPAKLGRGNYFTVFGADGLNYYELTGITSTDASGVYTLTAPLSPQDAYIIDSKIDDGFPRTGVVYAVGAAGALNVTSVAAAPAPGVCVSNASGNPYNTGSTTYTDGCQLRFRFN